MQQRLILRRKYRIGRQGKSIWVRAFGDEGQIAEIRIAAAGAGSEHATGAAARRLDAQLRDYFSGRFGRLDFGRLPLAANGSRPHQRLCMKFLAGIPLGETRTYQQEAQAVARACGSRPSARAAGQANRRNLFPIVVPCHRIVASPGRGSSRLGGFMGGTRSAALGLKRSLLAHEGALPS